MELRISMRTLTAILLLLATPAFGAKSAEKDSLYQVDSRWQEASGDDLKLQDLQGSPIVVTMVYTKCQYTCPRIVQKLKSIEKALSSRPEVKFVIISFDHKNDTPKVLAEFMKERELLPGRWKVLAGKDSGSIRRIAALLDISYKLEKNGEYSHSNVITLLDKSGVKRASVNGIAADHTKLIETALRL